MLVIATILSAGMLLQYSFGLAEEAAAVERAIEDVLNEGWRTRDIANDETPEDRVVGTEGMGALVVERV